VKRFRRRRERGMRHLLVAALLAAVPACSFPALAQAGPAEPSVPGKIAVGSGHKLFLVTHATGVQIYSCNATAGGYAWGLVAPRAELYGTNGKLIGTHFAGPTWQARDGSSVVGQRVDGVTVDADAIPWLLLSAASTSAGSDGDRFAGTTYIQRLATTGGIAPPAGDCNADTAGDRAEIPYTADYYFWKAN